MAETTTRERPILFSGAMIRRLLDGSKTVTRRVVKHHLPVGPCDVRMMAEGPQIYGAGGAWLDLPCPYGAPGDELYVRETWGLAAGNHEYLAIRYRADESRRIIPGKTLLNVGTNNWSWRPSIHMPRWASRIQLVIESVWVERLQEITEGDCIAEGIAEPIDNPDYDDADPCDDSPHSYRAAFINLWQSINGKSHPWESNPCVWRVQFTRKGE